MTDIDDDGYRVIPPRSDQIVKGVKCGACGMKFNNGEAIAYSCPRNDCPVFLKAMCGHFETVEWMKTQ